MRRAEILTAWSKLRLDEGMRLRVDCGGVSPLAKFSEELPSGIAVICGLNGVGKSTLLRLIGLGLGAADVPSPLPRRPLSAVGSFTVNVVGHRADAFKGAEAIDAFGLVSQLAGASSQPNFEDLFEGVDPHVMSADELDEIRQIVGLEYEEVEIFEIEDPQGEDDSYLAAPFATRGGIRYSYADMGAGELAVILLSWKIRRANPGSIVLIEEPESFASSHAVVSLLDLMAWMVWKRDVRFVITTHSIDVVARVPVDRVVVMVQSTGGSVPRRPAHRAELEWLLRSYSGQSRIVVVEDKAAAIVTKELLGRFGGIWASSMEVLGVGSHSDVVETCRRLPSARSLVLVGVVDGDQEHLGTDGPPAIIVLPGGADPNDMLKAAALDDVEGLARALERDPGQVEMAVGRLGSEDPHDWFAEMATALGITESEVMRSATACWLRDAQNERESEKFVKYLVNLALRTPGTVGRPCRDT